MLPIISGVVELAKGWFSHRQAKTEAKRAVQLKQIEARGVADQASASDMKTSWKDEYLTIVFTVPIIVVFYAAVWGDPQVIERVQTAFAAMQSLPEWYMWAVVGIVIGTFGLRGLAKFVK